MKSQWDLMRVVYTSYLGTLSVICVGVDVFKTLYCHRHRGLHNVDDGETLQAWHLHDWNLDDEYRTASCWPKHFMCAGHSDDGDC